mgnify:CR=1 FL=1
MSPLGRLQWLLLLARNPAVKPAALRVGTALAYRQNSRTGQLNPSIDCLARDTSIAVRSVRRSLRELEVLGVVETDQSIGGNASNTNQYCLVPLTDPSPLTTESPLTGESATPDSPVRLPLTGESPKQGIEQGKEQGNNRNRENAVPAEAGESSNSASYITKRKRKLTGQQLGWFLEFWEAFDYRKGKAEAADAWLDVKVTEDLFAEIMAGAKRAALTRTKPGEHGPAPKLSLIHI